MNTGLQDTMVSFLHDLHSKSAEATLPFLLMSHDIDETKAVLTTPHSHS